MFIDYIGISDKAKVIKGYFRSQGVRMTPESVCKLHRKHDPIHMNICLCEYQADISTEVFKGCYVYKKKQHVILYNRQLGDCRDVVLYHEIGHRLLHWRIPDFLFHMDQDLRNVQTCYEVEANVFAAEMLLDDSDVLEALFDQELTFFEAARALGVPDEILCYKCRILQARGYDINIPISAAGDFMKGKAY